MPEAVNPQGLLRSRVCPASVWPPFSPSCVGSIALLLLLFSRTGELAKGSVAAQAKARFT
jgi:hypothetical protein